MQQWDYLGQEAEVDSEVGWGLGGWMVWVSFRLLVLLLFIKDSVFEIK